MHRWLIKFLLTLTPLFWRGVGGEIFAQNLVKNPSFENYIQCPVSWNQFNGYISDWFGFTSGGPSFFHSCSNSGAGVPLNVYGFQYAHTGQGYAQILVYSWDLDPDKRAYIEGSFTSLLKKDSVYCVSYYASLTNINYGAIKNVDAYLSDTIIDWNSGFSYNLVNITPQIKSPQIISDTLNWTKINGLYRAKGEEQYIVIGNFLSDQLTTVLLTPNCMCTHSDYYIDDVSVTPTNLIAPNLGKDTVICKNTLPYNLSAPQGYDSYLWSNGATSTTLAANDSGTYWVKCILAGCGEITDTVHIGFIPEPTLQLGSDTVLCKGETLLISAQQGFQSYLWNTNETAQNITVNDSGLYIVNATSVCGSQTDSIHLSLDSLPNIIIDIGTDTTICNNGTNVPLLLTSSTPLPDYEWSNGSTANQLLVKHKGWYWLRSNFRCGVIQSDSIFVDDCVEDSLSGIFIPSSFTPNHDGLNDVWQPVFTNLTIENVSIYNRWGEKINSRMYWDGYYHGLPSPQGVYGYIIRYRNKNGELLYKTGTICLIR